jgi:hypothetical protein
MSFTAVCVCFLFYLPELQPHAELKQSHLKRGERDARTLTRCISSILEVGEETRMCFQ